MTDGDTAGDTAGGASESEPERASESEPEQDRTEQDKIDREVSQAAEALRATAREGQEKQKGAREGAGPLGIAARRQSPDEPTAAGLGPPSPAQWEELRAWGGDNLAAARAVLKDAGSVTGWSRVLVERARGLLRARTGRRESDGGPGQAERALVVRMEGDVNLATSPALLALLRRLAVDGGAMCQSRTVLVDLEAVGLLDGSGCAALLAGQKALARRGLDLVVVLRPCSQPEAAFLRQSLGTVLRRVESLDDL